MKTAFHGLFTSTKITNNSEILFTTCTEFYPKEVLLETVTIQKLMFDICLYDGNSLKHCTG